ncbi:MAG TPA: hydrogenase maturation protease [Steroidobacteraceae bacterium]
MARAAVIGIGNPDRGDDGAGRVIAHRLQDLVPSDVEVLQHDGEATALVAQLHDAPTVLIVDACQSGAAAGTVHRFDAHRAPLPAAQFGLSSHGFGLASAIELARALNQLPQRCIVYAVEGKCFDAGAGLSPPVTAAVAVITARILAELGARDQPAECF